MITPFLGRLFAAALCGWACSLPVAAAIFNYTANDGSNRALRLNVPDAPAVVRGILIWGNGSGDDARRFAEDAELVAFARSLDFCLIATSQWGNFSDASQAEFRLFTTGLAQLAAVSGRPELNNAPWLPLGHSNGGQMSYGLNVLRPDKVIAVVVSKGCCYSNARPSAAALRTPGLLIAGQNDTELRRTNIRDLFTGNRPRGALWAWAEEEGIGHDEGETATLIRPFAEECVRLRLPADADPRRGPVALRDLAESGGWLVETDAFSRGFGVIAAYPDFTGSRSAAGWLPTARLAALFRAFASHRKAGSNPTSLGAGGPGGFFAPRGSIIGYRIDAPAGNWTSLEIFEGATSLARFTPGEPRFGAQQNAGTAGYAAFHGVVTFADGSRRVTMPRRIFVEPSPAAPPGPVPLPAPPPAPPPPPVKLTQHTGSPLPIALSWDLQAGATGYRIERATAPAGPWTVLAETAVGAFTAVAVPAGPTYYYRVVTLGPDGDLAIGPPLAIETAPVRGSATRLRNVSARTLAGTGNATLIAGFTHAGGDARVLARVVGPSLASLGVAAPLADPTLELVRDGAVVAANDNWGAAANADELAALMNATGAFALPRTSLDAATVLALPAPAGAHSLVLGGGGGVALVEIYDAGPGTGGRLVNLSVRGAVSADPGALIVGFEISGDTPLTVLLRAAGPALAAFGVPGTLGDPRMTLFQGARELLLNDDWETNPNVGDVRRAAEQTGAFAFPAGSADAALLATLAPGAYTLVVSGRNAAAGIALVELYALL